MYNYILIHLHPLILKIRIFMNQFKLENQKKEIIIYILNYTNLDYLILKYLNLSLTLMALINNRNLFVILIN